MSKILYPIFKLPSENEDDVEYQAIPTWIKWWLLNNYNKKHSWVLSEIITGNPLTLENSVATKFYLPPLPRGNSEQDGEPSPSNEVPITNVTGDVEVLVQNKNLFDGSREKVYFNSSGIFENNNNAVTTKFIPAKAGNIFTISCDNTSAGIVIASFDKNKNLLLRSAIAGTSLSHTCPANTAYIIGSNANGMVNTTQLEKNSTATPYIPHKEQTFTFPLGTQRMFLGDYLADDGIHHVRGEYTVTGNESIGNFEIASNGCFAVTLGIKCKYGVYSGDKTYWLADKLKAYSLAKLRGSTPKIGICVLNDGFTYVNLTGEASTRESAIASWNDLAGMKIEYLMQNEEITPYTEPQQQAYDEIKQALSYNEQTNISGTSDEANPIFEVQYYMKNESEGD